MKKELMSWENCLQEYIKTIQVDKEKIKSIRKMCAVRQKVTKNIRLDEETASVIAENYYEIIKELLVALLNVFGYKSNNHECLIAFFKNQFPKYEYEIKIIYELKNVRNRIVYDGIFVKKSYLEKNKLEFEHIIELLNKLLDKNLKK